MESNQADHSPIKCMCVPVSVQAFPARASEEFSASLWNLIPLFRFRRIAIYRALLLALVPGLGFMPGLLAQKDSHCEGPPALEKAIAEHPTAAAYDALGAHFAGQSKLSCAIPAFRSAIRLDPNSWQGHYNLGVALLTSGNAKQAAGELNSASKLNPGSAQILLPLGVALSDVNRQDEAIDAFRAVLQQDPHSVRAMDGLTKALIEQKRYTAAIAELKNAPDDEVLA